MCIGYTGTYFFSSFSKISFETSALEPIAYRTSTHRNSSFNAINEEIGGLITLALTFSPLEIVKITWYNSWVDMTLSSRLKGALPAKGIVCELGLAWFHL